MCFLPRLARSHTVCPPLGCAAAAPVGGCTCQCEAPRAVGRDALRALRQMPRWLGNPFRKIDNSASFDVGTCSLFRQGLGELCNGNRVIATIRIVCFQWHSTSGKSGSVPWPQRRIVIAKALKCVTQNEELHERNLIT